MQVAGSGTHTCRCRSDIFTVSAGQPVGYLSFSQVTCGFDLSLQMQVAVLKVKTGQVAGHLQVNLYLWHALVDTVFSVARTKMRGNKTEIDEDISS